jgi:hypothetical protein
MVRVAVEGVVASVVMVAFVVGDVVAVASVVAVTATVGVVCAVVVASKNRSKMSKIIAIDFETYFDDDFTLKKLTTEEYVRDPRFEVHGAAVYLSGAESVWMTPEQLKEYCEVLERYRKTGNKIVMLAHHAHFDGFILNEHFDFRPDFWIDTLSMARVVFDSGVKNGLDDVAARLGLKPKSVPYGKFKGKHWHELDQETQTEVANGAAHDCKLAFDAFTFMMTGKAVDETGKHVKHSAVPYAFPASELPVIDMTVKMFTEPMLVGDLDLLGQAWVAERKQAINLFRRIGLTGTYDECAGQLRKDDVFASMLESIGVEPALKITNKGNEKFAFAKSDWFMQELAASDDPDVVALAEARLKAQSSIYRTRVERFGWISRRGPIPIYLSYAAAHTRRWGGGDKQNAQNLPRPDPYRPEKGALRRAIKAP